MYCTDHCYHHYDDFILPKRGFFKGAWSKVWGDKDVHDLKAQSVRLYLECYSDAFDNPPILRSLLCQDVSITIEDIRSKFTHVKDGYSSPISYSWTKPLDMSSCLKVISVSTPLSPTYSVML